MRTPTAYPELNAVLGELVAGARGILAENFRGAYLQGSFALGEADEHGDVDFIVVTHDEVGEGQVALLQQLHRRIYAIEIPWAQHLEGSYVPEGRLRRVDPSRSSFLYLDNGASELTRDSHCNTAVVRWTLRERGIVLAGPRPTSLVDPVSADQLRAEIAREVREWSEWAPAPTKAGGMSCWKQTLLVLSFCRMLHTLECGEITSKRAAGEWALGALDPDWASLIRRALDDRPDPWVRVYQPADEETAGRTLAFAEYAVEEAARFSPARRGRARKPRQP